MPSLETEAMELTESDIIAILANHKTQQKELRAVKDVEAVKNGDSKNGSKDTVDKNGEVDRTPGGMLADIKNLYQKQDKEGQMQWVTEYPDDVIVAAENTETARFAFLVRNKISSDSRKTLEIDSVIIQSPLLKEALGEILKDYPGITTSLKRLVFKSPFQPFVHRWGKLVQKLDSMEDSIAKLHLKLFHGVLHEELKDAIAAKNDLVANGVITFDHLWTIFEPGVLIYGTEEGKERVYGLNSSNYATDSDTGLPCFRMLGWYVDFDGEKFGSSQTWLSTGTFEGTKSITRLPYLPLDFHPQKKDLVDRLIARGKIFENFAGYHFMAYRGVGLTYGRCGLVKQIVDSRVIIDCDAHNRFMPNYAIRLNNLGAKTHTRLFENDDSDFEGSDAEDDDSEDHDEEDVDNSDGYTATPNENGTTANKVKHRSLTSKELLLAVPFVRGYALKNKKWFILFVDQIIPIKFSDNAFQSLVMAKEQKELILAVVESQVEHKDQFDDVIEGKGRGMIMLLSGPPGVGKTLTAESVAEHMRVPLYMMSAGDLGLDPFGIENSLNTILEMVAKWNAVLLLDEADVFLEARSTSDLERNKLVSIFLRMLEYYEGILFLTTNRIKNIDEAFHSRIHISMQYPSLTAASRKHIWQAFMSKTTGLDDEQLDSLAKVELNGRQIKNVLKTAQMLAGRGGSDGKINMEHIQTILAIERGKAW